MSDSQLDQSARDLILQGFDRCRAICARRQAALAERLGLAPPEPSGKLPPASDLALYSRGPDGAAPIRQYFQEVSGGLPDMANETLDAETLDAMCNAVFSLFRILGRDENAGVRALDLLSGETLWIVDRELERSADPGAELALRVFRVHEFWMTTGAAVALNEAVWRELEDIGVSRAPSRPSVSWLDRDALAQAVYHLAA